MSVGTLIWIILFGIQIIELILCGVYARVRKRHDMRKCDLQENRKNMTTKVDQDTVKRKLIRRLDNLIYGLCRYVSICVGRIPSHTVRRIIFKRVFCMRIDRHAIIHGGCEIRSPWNISIGNSVIGVGAILDGRNGIVIEDDVVMATGVWIWTEQHDSQDPYFRCLDKGGKVVIKRHAWIGNRVTILPKVEVGEGSVIAAGAVLTKNSDSFAMYGGIPAKKIHDRNSDLRYTDVAVNIWSIY